jgi:hypothetical protein
VYTSTTKETQIRRYSYSSCSSECVCLYKHQCTDYIGKVQPVDHNGSEAKYLLMYKGLAELYKETAVLLSLLFAMHYC